MLVVVVVVVLSLLVFVVVVFAVDGDAVGVVDGGVDVGSVGVGCSCLLVISTAPVLVIPVQLFVVGCWLLVVLLVVMWC